MERDHEWFSRLGDQGLTLLVGGGSPEVLIVISFGRVVWMLEKVSFGRVVWMLEKAGISPEIVKEKRKPTICCARNIA